MENNLIMFKNMTPVMRSREVLKRNGIRSAVVRTPSHLRNRSCGYSLLVKRNFDRAISLLKANKICIVGTAWVESI